MKWKKNVYEEDEIWLKNKYTRDALDGGKSFQKYIVISSSALAKHRTRIIAVFHARRSLPIVFCLFMWKSLNNNKMQCMCQCMAWYFMCALVISSHFLSSMWSVCWSYERAHSHWQPQKCIDGFADFVSHFSHPIRCVSFRCTTPFSPLSALWMKCEMCAHNNLRRQNNIFIFSFFIILCGRSTSCHSLRFISFIIWLFFLPHHQSIEWTQTKDNIRCRRCVYVYRQLFTPVYPQWASYART